MCDPLRTKKSEDSVGVGHVRILWAGMLWCSDYTFTECDHWLAAPRIGLFMGPLIAVQVSYFLHLSASDS
jgi:hypothetical protein